MNTCSWIMDNDEPCGEICEGRTAMCASHNRQLRKMKGKLQEGKNKIVEIIGTCKWAEPDNYCFNLVEGKTDYCAHHNRLIRKESENEKKQVEKKANLIAQAALKNQVPRAKINKVSEKQKSLNEQYKEIADDYKKRNPECKAKVSPYCTKDTTDVHHTKGRGAHLLDETTFLPVCRSCHIWIGDNHKEAEAKGLVFSRLATIKPTI